MKSILRRNDPGYDAERHGFQLVAAHEPDLIVPATGPDDVRRAVAHAAAADLPVAVQAAGHGLPIAATGGLLITTRRMDGVTVDPVTATARVEAGAKWERVIAEAARHGLAPLSGSSPNVGAVSYTLGGGIGLLARRYGYAADQVRSLDVVTADGEARHVAPDDDLYWALVGGRGAFGVVTAVEIGLVPVTTLYGGALWYDTDHLEDVLRTWTGWTTSVPDEMTSSVAIIPFPDIPQAPPPFRGRRVAHVRIAYLGGPEAGEELVRPLRAIAPRLVDTVGELPYTASDSIHSDPKDPAGYFATHVLLREPPAPDPLLDARDRVVEIRHLGGALSKPQGPPNSVGNRDAAYFAGVLSPGLAPGTDTGVLRPAHDRVTRALEPWATGGRALNFLYGANATPEEVRKAYEPADYERLTALKAEWDPRNLFRLTHNIPPRP